MKEQLLKGILHILAIVAKDEDVTESERESARRFLLQNLRSNDVQQYINFFEEVSISLAKQSAEEDQLLLQKIAKNLNSELNEAEKIIIMVSLMELIAADGIITETEKKLLYLTGSCFKIEPPIIALIKTFGASQKKEQLNSPNILLIDKTKKDHTALHKHIQHSSLEGMLAVLHIPAHKIYFIKYIGKDEAYLNSMPLLNGHCVHLAIGSVIKTRTKTFYQTDVVNQFYHQKRHKELLLEVNNISYVFRNNTIGLRQISFQEEAGKLVAIMGGSGSGKSTLLNVINGNLKPKTGQVTINGHSVHKKDPRIKGLIGYVPQEDMLIEELSVYDNLYYASKLCCGHLSEEKINTRVHQTLTKLGLDEIKSLKVGSLMDKIISGGQRKRINIALEVIREPSILFIDEPTSGLSSRDSELIITLLKELTFKGTLIFTVIHQPSSDIFKMFDRLLILDTGGYTIYHGNPMQAIVYFKDIVDRIDKDRSQCIECGNVNAEQIFSIIETKVINEYGKETEKRKILPKTWHTYFKKEINKEHKPYLNPQPTRC